MHYFAFQEIRNHSLQIKISRMNSCMPVLSQEHNILVELCFLVSNRDFIAEALAQSL